MGLYQWVGPGTDIGDGNNWRDEIHGTTGTEPGGSDDVTMFTAGTFTGALSVDMLALQSQGSGALTFAGGNTYVISEGTTAATVTGLVTFNYSEFAPDGLTVSEGSTLRLSGGAIFEDSFGTDNDVTIGSQMGTAAVVVDNAVYNAQLNAGTLTVGAGSSGIGKLTVENGGNFFSAAGLTLLGGGDSGSRGTVLVTGATSQAEFDGRVEIGGGGQGAFTVSAGAYASLGLHDNVAVGSLNATGTITATGADSLLSVAGNLEFGAYANGSSGAGIVSQGATLAVAGDILGYTGSLSATGAGSVLSGRFYESMNAVDQLSITTGATARFIAADIQAGDVLLQDGTLSVRSTLQDFAKVSGHGVITATSVENYGTLSASGGTLQVSGTLTGPGSDIITKASTLELDGSVAAQAKIAFQTGASTLSLKDAADMAGVIRGFGAGETIDLLNDPATQMSFANDILTISNGSTVEAKLHFTGSYTAANFKLASDGHGGSRVTYAAPASPRDSAHAGPISFVPHTA